LEGGENALKTAYLCHLPEKRRSASIGTAITHHYNMEIENSTPAPEIPVVPPMAETDQTPRPPVATAAAAPPAAALVVQGEIKSERELKLEKKLADAEAAQRRAEVIASEKELEAQTLREIQSRPPEAPTKPSKVKRKFLINTLLRSEVEEEA